jgi:hypothetical protein
MVAASAPVCLASDDAALQAELDALRAEVAQLRDASPSWLNEARAAEIRGIVTDVLADAGTRSSLQSSGQNAGYNGGYFISSADGAFSLKLNLLEQIRWSFNDNDSDWQAHGFENKRTRLEFSGNAVDQTWRYQLSYYLAYSDSVEDFGAGELSDAFISKSFECGAALTVGQFELPFSAESSLDVANMQFMDFSVVNSFYEIGFGQGIMVGYEGDAISFEAAYSNAFREANADWNPDSPGADWAFTGRVVGKLAGNWSQFTHGQSWQGDGLGVAIGSGLAAERSNDATGTSSLNFTLDGTVAFGGANASAAYFLTKADDTGIAAVDDANLQGIVLSGGIFVTGDIELVARYEWSDLDIPIGGAEDFSVMTLGGNWYIDRNLLKLSFDFSYAFDAVSPIYEVYAIGNNWLADAPGNDGQWVVRSQLSFSF